MPRVRAACVAFVLTIAPAATLVADDQPRRSTQIGLPEVLQVALRKSPTLTRAFIDVDIARADVLAAQGLDDFTITGTALVSRAQSFDYAGSTGGFFQQDLVSIDLGVTRSLSTGGTISGALSGQRVKDTFRVEGMPTLSLFDGFGTAVTVSALQPLVRGRGERVARADVRRAAIARDVATLQQTAEALETAKDVIIAYWQVAHAVQVVAIRAEGVKLATQQLRITERAVRAGTVSPTEGLAAEQAIALREQAVLLAQVELSQLSLELRRRAGLELGREIDLTPTTPLAVPGQTFEPEAAIARALAENPTLALLAARGKGAEVDIDVAEDAVRPRVDIFASVGTGSRAAQTSAAVEQLGSFENPAFTVSLRYEQQLGARAARGATERARGVRRRARVDLEEARREIVVSVSHAIDLLRAARKRIEVSERAIGLVRRTLEIEQTRFANGKSTNFDVLLRQDELQQASLARALAVADALAAEATVHALTGDLLARHRIRIAPQ
jgi:outer membrane protein TolC